MQLAVTYAKAVDNVVAEVKKEPKNNIAATIARSERLGKLTQTVLEAITRIERVANEYEALLSHVDFGIRQKYNIARYKLDKAASARNWDYYGRANYIWAG